MEQDQGDLSRSLFGLICTTIWNHFDPFRGLDLGLGRKKKIKKKKITKMYWKKIGFFLLSNNFCWGRKILWRKIGWFGFCETNFWWEIIWLKKVMMKKYLIKKIFSPKKLRIFFILIFLVLIFLVHKIFVETTFSKNK